VGQRQKDAGPSALSDHPFCTWCGDDNEEVREGAEVELVTDHDIGLTFLWYVHCVQMAGSWVEELLGMQAESGRL
jgi:hypothetical protein